MAYDIPEIRIFNYQYIQMLIGITMWMKGKA
jgi:hypothetical protein